MTPEQKQHQIDFIAKSEQSLGFNATQMHKALKVHQKTYSKWRTGETEMTAIAYTAVDFLVKMNANSAELNQFTTELIEAVKNSKTLSYDGVRFEISNDLASKVIEKLRN